MAEVFRLVDQRQDVVTVLILLLLCEDVFDLLRVDARQANDFAEEFCIGRILVTEVEVGVALTDERVKQPVLLSLFKQLRPLECDHESRFELS